MSSYHQPATKIALSRSFGLSALGTGPECRYQPGCTGFEVKNPKGGTCEHEQATQAGFLTLWSGQVRKSGRCSSSKRPKKELRSLQLATWNVPKRQV